jgi:prophage regulatory protein
MGHYPVEKVMRLLSKKEVAAMLEYHPEHLMRLAREGRFPKPLKATAGGRCRWDAADIEAWVEERKAAA